MLITEYRTGGDVGNRTRVRKIRPADLYERSRLIVFARCASSGKGHRLANRWDPKVLFRPLSGVWWAALRHFDARPFHRQEYGEGGRGSVLESRLLSKSLMQREEEQRRKCGWHLFFALIYRGRCLSARNPGPASPVETCHPRCSYYTC